MGWLGRTHVEVTAGLREPNDAPPMPRQQGLGAGGEVDVRRINDAADELTEEPSLPPPLQRCREALLRTGVSPATAQRWIAGTTSFAAGVGETGAEMSWLEHLQRTVSRELKLAGPIRTRAGQRHVVALVGPTGVGKTTTIAKLAAGFRIEARRRVGLLTIDTFRIAAVGQLKAYAEIMDLPMEVVEKSGEMRAALQRLGDVDLVLIDTAGRSPRSDARIEQLVEMLGAAQPDETHLVLSATGAPSTTASVLEGFAPVQPTAAILTKLDETPHTAAALSALASPHPGAAVPLSYLTHGQQVPEDISVATAERLVSRLLPQDPPAVRMEAA